MIHSVDHFLTTHVGSLPRPEELIQMMYSKEEGKPVDQLLLAAQVRAAVADVVAKQRKSGMAIVSDGEMSKPSYATYVKDRLACALRRLRPPRRPHPALRGEGGVGQSA